MKPSTRIETHHGTNTFVEERSGTVPHPSLVSERLRTGPGRHRGLRPGSAECGCGARIEQPARAAPARPHAPPSSLPTPSPRCLSFAGPAFRKRGPQRAVDQARGQRLVFPGPAVPLDERPRGATGGGEPLLVVDLQGHEGAVADGWAVGARRGIDDLSNGNGFGFCRVLGVGVRLKVVCDT